MSLYLPGRCMSFELSTHNIEKNLSPSDFAWAFVDSAFTQPIHAVQQLTGKKIETTAAPETLAGKAGQLAGFVLDFTLLSKLTGAASRPLLGTAAESVLGSSAKMFIAGGLYGGLLTPSEGNGNLLSERLQNGFMSGSTFAVMGGVASKLDGAPLLKAEAKDEFAFGRKPSINLLKSVRNNALAGVAGGALNAEETSYLKVGHSASLGTVLETAGQYGLFGAGFGAVDAGIANGVKRIGEIPAVSDARARANWKVYETKIEAKKQYYSTLNAFDMRHPFKRLGDFVYGSDVPPQPRAELTAENNPVHLLERELPEYFKTVAAKHQEMEDTPDRRASYEIFQSLREVHTDFVHRLYTLWRGTDTQPGISQFTDAELSSTEHALPDTDRRFSTATSSPEDPGSPLRGAAITTERIAQIREVLTRPAKADYPNADPLTLGLADLAGVKLDAHDARETYSILDGLESGKERFYGYNLDDMQHKMQMPREHAYIDHGYNTPVSWMPYEPTADLPNLFHGTISHALPSIFREGTMLPARELRLRGIGQATGESANEEFPRRSISLTRDFNEAYAYHRHSPASLDSFPVVFGVSRDVIPNMVRAGALEPGELLVNKINLGNSLATKLGFRKPQLTHVFVPDSEVPSVQGLLQRFRVNGVLVRGFNQLPQPDWSPVSTEQLQHVIR